MALRATRAVSESCHSGASCGLALRHRSPDGSRATRAVGDSILLGSTAFDLDPWKQDPKVLAILGAAGLWASANTVNGRTHILL